MVSTDSNDSSSKALSALSNGLAEAVAAIAPCLPLQVPTEGVFVSLWRETIIDCKP